MRLGRERAQGHRAADEVLHDGVDGLDGIVVRGRGLVALELQLRAERDAARAVKVVGVAVEAGVVVVAHRLAEVDEALRRPEVLLAALARAVLAADAQRLCASARDHFLEILQLQAADWRDDALEVLRHELWTEPDGLEDLRRAVGPERRDAHLRHDLHQPLAHRRDVVGGGQVGGGLRTHRVERGRLDGGAGKPRPADLRDGLQREPGVDRRRAKAEQDGEVVHLAHLAGLDDDADGRPQAGVRKRLVDRRDRKQ